MRGYHFLISASYPYPLKTIRIPYSYPIHVDDVNCYPYPIRIHGSYVTITPRVKIFCFNSCRCLWHFFDSQCMYALTLIQPASKWMHSATLWRHSDLFWAATSASSQVIPILDKSLLTMYVYWHRFKYPQILRAPEIVMTIWCAGWYLWYKPVRGIPTQGSLGNGSPTWMRARLLSAPEECRRINDLIALAQLDAIRAVA